MHKLLPPTLVAILVVVMIATALVVSSPSFSVPIRLLGIVVLAIGIALSARNAALFDKVGANIKTFDKPTALVRSGAFTWSRNPMYLGFTLFLVGLALVLGKAAALVGPIVFFIAADRWYIPFEERRMDATFGSDYDQYRHQVRRWIGRR